MSEDWPPRFTVDFYGMVKNAIAQMPNENVSKAAVISLDSLCEERFQAGLKRAVEIVRAEEELDGPIPESLQHWSAEKIAHAAVTLTKKNIEQAILKEMDGEQPKDG